MATASATDGNKLRIFRVEDMLRRMQNKKKFQKRTFFGDPWNFGTHDSGLKIRSVFHHVFLSFTVSIIDNDPSTSTILFIVHFAL